MIRKFLLLVLVIPLTAIGAPIPLPTGVDLAGESVSPFSVTAETKAVVLFFTAPDCPISNRYAPTMARLAAEFAPQGITSWLVYSDDLVKADDIQTHQREYQLSLPTAIDPAFSIADFAQANVTPEVAVFVFAEGTRIPTPVYLGRIDDQYQGFGKYRPAATQHELRTLLTHMVAGHIPEFVKTKAIGCYIPRPKN